jgi:UDP-GlcNAc:undecaprenyl-phosphate GlcNAc-1-phosphate transferase
VTGAILALGAAVVGALAARRVAAALVPAAPLVRPNYRGIPVATGAGVAIVMGLVAGTALVALVHAVAPEAPGPAHALAAGEPLALLAFGFGLIGLLDDLAAQPERGWRSHLPALLRGRLTPGALKVAGGGALALAVAAGRAESLPEALADAALIALAANLSNALDVRPGRAAKAFLAGAVPLAVLAADVRAPLAAALGATVAFLPMDLRERAMLGDAGAGALGAVLGGAVVLARPPAWGTLALLAGLAVLAAVAEGPTLSAWIDRMAPLRAADRAGRVRP